MEWNNGIMKWNDLGVCVRLFVRKEYKDLKIE